MRQPARLFATAVLTAMMSIAVIALIVDAMSSRPARHGPAPQAGVAGVIQLGAADLLPATGSGVTGGAARTSGASGVSGTPAAAVPESDTSSSAATTPPTAAGSASGTPTGGTSARPADGAAARPASKPQARPQTTRRPVVRTRGMPDDVTRSHYLRTLTGDAALDVPRMTALGAGDGRANNSGQEHVVLLDIGGQRGDGVQLSTTTRWVSYGGLVRALVAYVRGYHSTQRRAAPVTVAIGTNNDLQTSQWTGAQWAQQVVAPVRRAAAGYRGITVAGADDIEPGFHAGPARTKAWVAGFLSATKASLVFNGSADGCSAIEPGSRCIRGWTAADLAWVAGRAAPERVSALPQVYNVTMAQQWAMISLTAIQDGSRPLHFRGPLTENAACRGEKHCPTMGSTAAWQALSVSLRAIGTVLLPARTDLDVQ